MDAHYHRDGFATFFSLEGREFRFCGVHPWQAEAVDDPLAVLAPLADDPHAGVGEIGLDRLKTKTISPRQRAVFERQLAYAAEWRRPVVLHGAKCWGEVTAACRPYAGRIPAFLFHGFSRSGGLVPDIVSLNGYFSVGPALLNDHAVNYRQLVASLPEDRLLVETDADYTAAETVPEIGEIVAGLAQARGKSVAACEAFLTANGRRFTETLR
jgi:TatD DNase family protein